MNPSLLYALLGVALFFLGFYRFIVVSDMLIRIIALNVAGVGIFMYLVAGAYASASATDPIPHAMVLTGIVVSLAATALAIMLTMRTLKAESKQRHSND